MNYRYSLANYVVVIESDDPDVRAILGQLRIGDKRNTIGGEGDAVDEINIEVNDNMWNTTGFATGAWVHNKSLSRVGKVSININQLSKHTVALTRLYNVYYEGDHEGVIITIYDNSMTNGKAVASCKDCYLEKIPATSLQNEAQMNTWTFTCGEVEFVTI